MAAKTNAILRERILARMKAQGRKPAELSRAIGRGSDYLADFLADRKKSLGHQEVTALAIELQTTVPWLEGDSGAPQESPAAGYLRPASRTIPVHGLAAGSFNGAEQVMTDAPIDYVPCPPGLAAARDGYALFADGNSMEPRYFSGDVLFIHPHKPIRLGDFVVIQVQAHEGAAVQSWVKQLVTTTGDEVVVRQFNPAKEIRFNRKYVKAMHRILTPNEMAGI